MMLDVTVVAREIRRRVASYPEFCSAGCMLHDTISISKYVQYSSHAVYSTVQCTCTVSCSVQCTGAGCWPVTFNDEKCCLLGWGPGPQHAWCLVWGSAFTPALIILLINWNLELQTFSFVLNLQIGFNIVQVQCQCYGEDSVTCVPVPSPPLQAEETWRYHVNGVDIM